MTFRRWITWSHSAINFNCGTASGKVAVNLTGAVDSFDPTEPGTLAHRGGSLSLHD